MPCRDCITERDTPPKWPTSRGQKGGRCQFFPSLHGSSSVQGGGALVGEAPATLAIDDRGDVVDVGQPTTPRPPPIGGQCACVGPGSWTCHRARDPLLRFGPCSMLGHAVGTDPGLGRDRALRWSPLTASDLGFSRGGDDGVRFHDLVDTMSQDIVDTC